MVHNETASVRCCERGRDKEGPSSERELATRVSSETTWARARRHEQTLQLDAPTSVGRRVVGSVEAASKAHTPVRVRARRKPLRGHRFRGSAPTRPARKSCPWDGGRLEGALLFSADGHGRHGLRIALPAPGARTRPRSGAGSSGPERPRGNTRALWAGKTIRTHSTPTLSTPASATSVAIRRAEGAEHQAFNLLREEEDGVSKRQAKRHSVSAESSGPCLEETATARDSGLAMGTGGAANKPADLGQRGE